MAAVFGTGRASQHARPGFESETVGEAQFAPGGATAVLAVVAVVAVLGGCVVVVGTVVAARSVTLWFVVRPMFTAALLL